MKDAEDHNAKLIRQLEDKEKQLASEKSNMKDAEDHNAKLIRQLEDKEKQLASVEQSLIDVLERERKLLESTSWRMTAPLRKMRTLSPGFFRPIKSKLENANGLQVIEASSPVVSEFRPSSVSSSSADSSILQASAEKRRQLFLDWLERNTHSQYDFDHKTRFWETYIRLDPYLESRKRLLELGDESKITNYLKSQLGLSVDVYGEDLRYPFDLSNTDYDLVLCLEVIEHIKDRTETQGIGEIAMFTRSGVRNVFSECGRVLKERGVLFMTTPNACCIDSIARIFRYQAPQSYALHVREFSATELTELARESGFALVAYSTANVWCPHPTIDRDQAIAILQAGQIPLENRGDDMFLVFQKDKGV